MRTLRPSGHLIPLSARSRRSVAAALVAAVVLVGCGGDDEPAEAPPAEPGQPIEVTGRAGLVFHDLSTSGTLVFAEGDEGDLPVEADDTAIQAAADAVRQWLDDVLSERNQGLTTTVSASDVDAAAFATAIGADGPATGGIPDTQVANATYLIEVAYLGEPGWTLARVESVLVDSSDPATESGRRLDTFVFTIDEAGAVDFIALEVAPVTNRTRRTVVMLVVGAMVVLPLVGLLAMERITAVEPSTDRPLAILLLGSDAGPPRDDDTVTGRADGFQLLFVSEERDHATFVSFPRDSWVPVTGMGDTKINACMTRGPENCVTTVEDVFGIDVDAYFVTSMWGFADAVNEFVGCDIGDPEVSRGCTRGLTYDVDFTCSSGCGGFAIEEEGEQLVSGFEALTVARNRKSRAGGDFTRSTSQAELLAAAHAELKADGSIARMMDALRILRRHSVTDLTLPQLTRLGLDALRLDPAAVETTLAPARLGTVGAASVVFLEDETYELVAEAAATGRLPEAFRAG